MTLRTLLVRWATGSYDKVVIDTVADDGKALVVTGGTIGLGAVGSGGGVSSVAGTAPIASSGGTTPAISLNANGVDDTKLRQGAATSVIGRSANSTGNVADIASSADGDVLRRASGALGFGAIPAGSVSGLGTLATQSGTFSGTSSGTNTGDQTSVSGNAGTATKLQTARSINGIAFDGSADVAADVVATTVAASKTIAAGFALVVPRPLTLAAGQKLTVAAGGKVRVI